MPIYQTNELINELQQQTESFLQDIMTWQAGPAEKLLMQPAENKWSALQCLEHLNSYGHYYLPAIEKAIETAESKGWSAKEVFTAGWLGNYFTNLMKTPTEGKKLKKMKAPKSHTPVVDLNANKVLSEFLRQQKKILVLLKKAQNIDLNRTKVSISIARFIKLKLGDVFMFLLAHNHRHIIQAKNAIQLAAVKTAVQSEKLFI